MLSQKQKMFEVELGLINNESTRKLTEWLLDNLIPDRFFIIQPSSSGKYHPACTHKPGGLVMHTKRLIYFVKELARAHQLSPEDTDLLIVAGILHDIAKKSKYSSVDRDDFTNHPILAVQSLRQKETELLKYADRDKLDKIYSMITYHMGPFGPENINKRMSDFTELETIMYHADYLASRKELTTPIDKVNIVVPDGIKDE